MYDKVLETADENGMLKSGDKILAAVSGGADSVCLLYILAELREGRNIELRAVHIHHGIRDEEGDRDAAFVENLCHKWNVPVLIIHKDIPGYAREHGCSVEEAGRILRYEVFEEEAGKWGDAKVAVAHHGDDNAETILHNLFRGSGLKGLGGIRPVRGRIIRPLLHVSRTEIIEFLTGKDIPWCEDSTNGQNDYTRNKIRNQLIPLIISDINEGAVDHINHVGIQMIQADTYLEKTAGHILEECGKSEPGRIGICAASLQHEDSIIQTYVIRQMISFVSKSAKDITSKHIEDVQSLLGKTVGKRIALPYSISAIKTYDWLWIEENKLRPVVDNREVNDSRAFVFAEFCYENGMEIPKNQYTKWFDYGKIKGTLSVRYRRTGDYIILSAGGRKSVKSFMIDQKIPKDDRNKILLLAEENHVLWIIGYRISEYYKITEYTEKVLQVKYNGGESDGR